MNLDVKEIDGIVLEAVSRVCANTFVGCQSEFVMQHVIMESLLKIPGVAIETGTQGTSGRRRKEIMISGVRPVIFGVKRTLPKGMSLDFMMVKPFEYKLELKTRSEFGSCDTATAQTIAEDIGRVLLGQVDGFLLAIDASIYRALSTNMQPGRTRSYDIFNYFPEILNVGSGQHEFNGITNNWICVEAPTKTNRIVTLLKKVQA